MAEGIGPVTYSACGLLPKVLAPAVVQPLVAQAVVAPATSSRGRAIVSVLSRLGPRCREVAQVRLDDLYWRTGILPVRGKGTALDEIPMPVDVGSAIMDYLEHERPVSAHRNVFLQARAPRSQLMGHANPATTVIYARVDLYVLTILAREWPHRARRPGRSRSRDGRPGALSGGPPGTAPSPGRQVDHSRRIDQPILDLARRHRGESTTGHASVGWRACQLSVIRGFARYVHVQNPVLAQIIPMGLVPSKVVHAVPFISMHPTRPWH